MGLKITCDVSGAVRKMAALKARAIQARRGAMVGVVNHMAGAFKVECPTDTNRELRGWLQACQGAGGEAILLPALQQSRRRVFLAKVLADQIDKQRDYLKALLVEKHAWYDQHPRRPHNAAYGRLLRRIDKQKERMTRAEQVFKDFWKNDYVIVMMKGTSASLVGYEKGLSGKALNATIRIPIYGGEGRMTESGGMTVVRLRNKEPHSNAVEKRFNVTLRVLFSAHQYWLREGALEYRRRLVSGIGRASVMKVSA